MTFDETATLPISPDEAFALITQPDRLRRWQTVSARVDLRAGGEYRWTIVPGHTAAGTFREIEPGRRIVFGWGWEDSDGLPPDTSTVTVTLEPVASGTRVRLVHEGLDAELEASHAEGWMHYLGRLQRAATEGDAGPDAWAAVPDPLTRISAAEATLAACQHVLRRVTDADRDKPTPCEGITVQRMVEHLVESLAGLGAMAGGMVEVGDGGTPESRVAEAGRQAVEIWTRRGLDGTVKAGPNEMPAQLAADILPLELLLHGWDIAQATGQEVIASDEVTGFVLELAHEFIREPVRAGGSFGPEVQVGPDAHVLDRLVAYSGRTPAA